MRAYRTFCDPAPDVEPDRVDLEGRIMRLAQYYGRKRCFRMSPYAFRKTRVVLSHPVHGTMEFRTCGEAAAFLGIHQSRLSHMKRDGSTARYTGWTVAQ